MSEASILDRGYKEKTKNRVEIRGNKRVSIEQNIINVLLIK